MTRHKYLLLNELRDALREDSTGSSLTGRLKKVTPAPHLSYFSWVFLFDQSYVLLEELGNGHYAYVTPLAWFDCVVAKVTTFLDRITQ